MSKTEGTIIGAIITAIATVVAALIINHGHKETNTQPPSTQINRANRTKDVSPKKVITPPELTASKKESLSKYPCEEPASICPTDKELTTREERVNVQQLKHDEPKKYYVRATAYLLSEPLIGSSVLATVQGGDKLEILIENGRWIKVRDVTTGHQGYLKREYIEEVQ